MIDKLFAFNQTCYVRRHEDEKPEVHTRIVRNLTQPDKIIYGEVTIDGETWVMRHMHQDRWMSIGKKVDLDAMIQGLEQEPLSARERELATLPWQQCTRNRVM